MIKIGLFLMIESCETVITALSKAKPSYMYIRVSELCMSVLLSVSLFVMLSCFVILIDSEAIIHGHVVNDKDKNAQDGNK